MAPRFNLKKGDRFKIEKNEGLNNLKVHLTWDGEFQGKELDLDESTFLLNDEGIIGNEADFVFYNSDKREEPYDKTKFGAKRNWLEQVRPLSEDGSVLGSIDKREGDEEGELIDVCLDKVSPQVQEIVFVATIDNLDATFGDVEHATITLINADSGEELCSYQLNEAFASEDAVEFAKLFLNDEGEWEFEAIGVGHEGGLQTLIDLFA